MKVTSYVSQARKAGDFYLHYTRLAKTGQTYLVGTLEFDNPYIMKRVSAKGETTCGLPFYLLKKLQKLSGDSKKEFLLKELTKLSDTAQSKGDTLMYSWSSDRFRMLPIASVVKVLPLASVLRN
jgi:hypothetical protein